MRLSRWGWVAGICMGICQIAWAGGMTASGGDILLGEHDPWFIQGKNQVDYCVDIDPSSVSASRARIESLFVRALDYWKREFRDYYEKGAHPYFGLRVGFQKFVQIPCSGIEDLKIQVGYGTLSESQIQFLSSRRDITRIVGEAVRTEQNEKTLQSRGYIFIASDLGPDRYDGGPDTVERAWSHDGYLYYTFIHELGHVFGIPHIGGWFSNVMSEDFIESMLQKYWLKIIDFDQVRDLPRFFGPSNGYSVTSINPVNRSFFKLSASETGIEIKRQSSDVEYELKSISASSRGRVLGRFEASGSSTSDTLLISEYLGPHQKVFQIDPNHPFNRVFGPALISERLLGVIHLNSGKTVPAMMELSSDSADLMAVMDGTMTQIIDNAETEPIVRYR